MSDEYTCKKCKKSTNGGDGICINCGHCAVGEEIDDDMDTYESNDHDTGDYEIEDYGGFSDYDDEN